MKLASKVCVPRALTEAQLRMMWALRLESMDLKPGISREDDFQSFCKKVQRARFVVRLLDASRPNDRPRGFFVCLVNTLHVAGRRLVCFSPEYNFIAPQFRGSAANYLMGLHVATRVLRMGIGHRRILGFLTYLPSFLAVQKALPDLALLGERPLKPWKQSVLLSIGRLLGEEAFDPDTGLVTLNTIPRDQRQRMPYRAVHRRAAERYLAVNPHWREGYCGVAMAPVTMRGVVRAVAEAGTRQWRSLDAQRVLSRCLRMRQSAARGSVDGRMYFRLLAAVAAADGYIDPAEVDRLGWLLGRWDVRSPEAVARLLCKQAEESRADPLAFLAPSQIPRETATLYLRDAISIAVADGVLRAKEASIIRETARRMEAEHFLVSLDGPLQEAVGPEIL